jgi:hypothetical protein
MEFLNTELLIYFEIYISTMQKHKTYDIHIVVIYICCNFFNNKYMHLYRGQSGNSGSIAFRVWYNDIQELRSLLPSNTPFVALSNISYAVVKMSNQVNVIEYFDWLFCMLKSNGIITRNMGQDGDGHAHFDPIWRPNITINYMGVDQNIKF